MYFFDAKAWTVDKQIVLGGGGAISNGLEVAISGGWPFIWGMAGDNEVEVTISGENMTIKPKWPKSDINTSKKAFVFSKTPVETPNENRAITDSAPGHLLWPRTVFIGCLLMRVRDFGFKHLPHEMPASFRAIGCSRRNRFLVSSGFLTWILVPRLALV